MTTHGDFFFYMILKSEICGILVRITNHYLGGSRVHSLRLEGPFSARDGVLYFLDFRRDPVLDLYVYECNRGRLLYKVELPKLVRNLVDWDWFCPRFVVPISDTEICFVWMAMFYIFCAWVSISDEDEPKAEFLGVRCFGNGEMKG